MIIILIIVAVLLFISLIPINITADFGYGSPENKVFLHILRLKLTLYPSAPGKEEKSGKKKKKEKKAESSTAKEKPQKSISPQKVEALIKMFLSVRREVFSLIGYVLKKAIKVKELDLHLLLGTGEAMYTGMAVGAVEAFVYNVIGKLTDAKRPDTYNIDIRGNFAEAAFDGDIHITVYTRLVYAYCIVAKALVIFLKMKRNSK